MKRDSALVAKNYPSLEFRTDHVRGRVELIGDIVLKADCGISTSIAVRLEFPHDYPAREPDVFDAERRFKAAEGKALEDRHIDSRGKFCLWLPPRSQWSTTDPDALLKLLDYVSEHLERQLTYDITSEWPGGQYKHHSEGYAQFVAEELGVSENSPFVDAVLFRSDNIDPYETCPCGGVQKYKWCHRTKVLELRRRVARR